MVSELAEAAIEAALEAGEIQMALLPESRAAKQTRTKRNPADLVTRADRMSEDVIVGLLHERFPDHGIFAEEGSRYKGDEYRWLIDPLDGTTNFAYGVPVFCVSIGLERGGQVIAGVVYHPPLGEMFWAHRGGGAFLRRNGVDEAIRVSQIDTVATAMVATGLPYDIRESGNNIENIGRLCRKAIEVRILGAAALHLAYVAAGRVDAFWEPSLNPWDIAAGSLLVEESGGRVSHVSGSAFHVDCRDVLASNARVHEEMIRLLRS